MRKKIIMAEDSLTIINLTKNVLSKLNYEVTPAKTGKDVLNLLQKNEYDLILMDIIMPTMDGMECTKQIRKTDGKNKEIPIIAVTGNANGYNMKDFEAVGINDYLRKPLNYDVLLEKLKNYIGDN